MKLLIPFKKHWILLLIVFLALVLRLYRIETLTSFQGDQGRDLSVVLQIVAHHDLKLLGPPSTFGPYQGPLYYYILVPGMFLSHLQPIGALITAVVWDICGVVILYFLCKQFFSRKVALIAAFIYALSPLFVETGRTLLNAYFGRPILIAALYFLFKIIKSSKKVRAKDIAILGFLVGCLVQLHYNFLPFFAFCLFIPFFFRHIPKIFYYFSFLGGFLIASLPQILFELTHSFLNTHLLIASLNSGQAVGHFSADYVSFFFSTISYVFGWEDAGFGLIIIIFLFLVVANVFKHQSLSQKAFLKVAIAYLLFFLVVAFSSHVRIIYPAFHYYFSILSILIILMAVAISKLPSKIIFLSLLAFTLVSLYNLDLTRNNGFTMSPNWSLIRQEKIADTIAADAKDKSYWNVAEVIDGDTNGLPFRYLLSARGVNNYLGVADYPRSKILYLITSDPANKVTNTAVWEVQSFKPFKITRVWVEYKGINLYRLEKI